MLGPEYNENDYVNDWNSAVAVYNQMLADGTLPEADTTEESYTEEASTEE